jgi:hypothetical protein
MWQSFVIYFLSNVDQSEPFEYSHIFKKFILICISKKYNSITIATHCICLIYMISMHFLYKKIQTLLSTQNMWNVITFHCLSSSRCLAPTNGTKHVSWFNHVLVKGASHYSCLVERSLDKFSSRGRDRSPLKYINSGVCTS